VLGRPDEHGVRAFERPIVDPAAGERATDAADVVPRRGRPALPTRDYFDHATRFLLAQRDRGGEGVYTRLEQHYGKGRETLRTRIKGAEDRELLTKGEPNKPASRRPGPGFAPFWHSLVDDDPLKQLARDLLPSQVNPALSEERLSKPTKRRARRASEKGDTNA
jgi:hypothetical protein